jgi:hypothetical protein
MVKYQQGGGKYSPTAQSLQANNVPAAWGLNYWERLRVPALGGLPLGVANSALAATLNDFDTSSYYLDYAEDLKLYGFSVATNIWDIAFGFETTYRPDYPVKTPEPNILVNPLGFDWDEADVFQAQVAATRPMGRGPWNLWDDLLLMGEVGFNRVHGFSDDELNLDKFAWGGTVKAAFAYFYILPDLDLRVPITYNFNPEGTSDLGSFTEHEDSIGVGLNFTYKSVYQFGVSYVNFIGSSADQPKVDRDYVGFFTKYSF